MSIEQQLLDALFSVIMHSLPFCIVPKEVDIEDDWEQHCMKVEGWLDLEQPPLYDQFVSMLKATDALSDAKLIEFVENVTVVRIITDDYYDELSDYLQTNSDQFLPALSVMMKVIG